MEITKKEMAKILYDDALDLLESNDYKIAIDKINKAIALNADQNLLLACFSTLADIYAGLKDYKNARDNYLRVVEVCDLLIALPNA